MSERTIALVGNPNCGKTTLFNAFTGTDQRVGNWPGVTVERKEGRVKLGAEHATLVDLPGIYALLAASEDERVSRDYILSGEPGLVVDVIDATNLERNLFLTTQLLDMRVPVVVLLNMCDLAEARGIAIDAEELGRELGCPVLPVTATDKRSARRALEAIDGAWCEPHLPARRVAQPEPLERLAAEWQEDLSAVAASLGTDERWLALKLLERDAWAIDTVVAAGALDAATIEGRTTALEDEIDEAADIAIAEARYDFIEAAVEGAVSRPPARETASDRADRIVLNRYLGIPIFLGVMYLLFWFTINVGGAFIDFFDQAGGAIFVDGLSRVLVALGSPEWLVTIAAGVGAGVQAMLTFIPVVFTMFLGLSLLEDSGYMARAAFVMDRFMRWVGLPGKSFVPLLVGFGCNVPAIMATRTLENKRDRYLTVFMSPFMSCGARLPVYALFGAAFFGAAAGVMTLSLYVVGIAVAIVTGLLLKSTLFRGEATYFVMELPPYHMPRLGSTVRQSWRRLIVFMTRAKYIVPVILLLAVLNSVSMDGTLGNENTPKSALSQISKTITPAFAPMGVQQDNWQASVGVVTGLVAKEAVVGTLNSLYGQDAAAGGGQAVPSVAAGLGAAVATIPANLASVPSSLIDPLGLRIVGGSQSSVAADVGASTSVFGHMRAGFSEGRPQAYAYLLFVLLYLPCVAAFGAMTKEMGLRYTMLALGYLAVTAWSVATLFYQVTVERDWVWIGVAAGLLAAQALVFWAIGRRARASAAGKTAPAQSPSAA